MAETAAGDAVVRGTAAELDAWLWARGTRSALEFRGSADALAILDEVVRIGIQ